MTERRELVVWSSNKGGRFRHALAVVVTAICAVVAGCRSYTAIGEWVADLPAETATALGIDADTARRSP